MHIEKITSINQILTCKCNVTNRSKLSMKIYKVKKKQPKKTPQSPQIKKEILLL